MHGFDAPSHLAIINDVIVNQARGLEQLCGKSDWQRLLSVATYSFATEQNNEGP
jgi:hypothetical protein